MTCDLETDKGPSANGQLRHPPIPPRNRVTRLLSLLLTTNPKPNPQRTVPEDKELRLGARRKWQKSWRKQRQKLNVALKDQIAGKVTVSDQCINTITSEWL